MPQLLVVACLGTTAGCFGSTLYLDALPNINLNDSAGTRRSNIAFGESDPTATFDGTSVTFSRAVDISSISSWSVASTYGEALGNEFSSVSLYFRPQGGTWSLLETGSPDTSFDVQGFPNRVGDSNPNMYSTQDSYGLFVTMRNSYEDSFTPGVFYPIWRNTFNNLNLSLAAGTYEFGVNGVGANPDPNTGYGFWFNSFVNGQLSGSIQTDQSGTYLRCSYADLSGPCFVEDPVADGTWNKGANLNFEIDGTLAVASTGSVGNPEPGSAALIGAGLVFVGWLRRVRQNAR